MLGPSAIGRNSAYLNTIFPKSSLPLLSVVANLGLVLYLFVVGMELDPKIIATHWRKAGGVAFVGMAVPFALGIAISQLMFDTLQASDPKYAAVPFVSFFVFIGTAMSITAFPVLARILKESALIYTKPGAMSMGAAALNDAAAWCLLILAISIANAGDLSVAGLVFLSVVAFGVGLIVLVRPFFCRLVTYVEAQHSVALNNSLFCLTLILVFLSAWTTELLGVHAIFGAFLFGIIMPRDSHLFKECNDKIEELVLTLTLPIYFALSGLQTDVTQINTTAQGGMVVLVCFIATIGKYVGAGGAAYFAGSSVRESIVVAFLMNTRGLVELIVLNLGVTAGVLSQRTFSVMVIMCLFTTFITGPMVQCVYPPHMRELENDHPEEGTQHLVPKDAGDIERGVDRSPIEVGASMDVLALDVRLTVLVDRIEHLQGMMEVISCFLPNTTASALSVVAIKAHEPSLTDNDEFIGLNHEGRLIKLEAESTSYHENHARFVSANMGGKIEPQELLPLSMYLKAVGGDVQAYRMQGDPAEYPREIRTLSFRAGSTLMLFPWRPSQYVERLFWRTLKVFTAPIALVVHLNVALTSTLADEQAAASSTTRKRTNSEDENTGTPTRSRGISIDAPDSIPPPLGTRGRSASQSIEVSKKSYTPARLHRTGSTIEMMRVQKAVDEEDDTNEYSSSLLIRSVLAVITGASVDTALFPMMLRFAQRSFIEVKVVVTSDRRTFPVPVREALAQFQKLANGFPNITIEHLITPSTDIPFLIEFCSTNAENNTTNGRSNGSCYDVIAIGYGSGVPDEDAVNAATRIATRGRSQTVSEAISAAVSNPSVPDSMELRRQLGLPEAIASSTLPYPELGVLGCAIEEGGLANYLIVLHEPQGLINVARKTSRSSLPAVEGRISRSSSISGDLLKSLNPPPPPPPPTATNEPFSGDNSSPKLSSSSKKEQKKTIFSIPEIDIESLDLDIEEEGEGDDKGNELAVGEGEDSQHVRMVSPPRVATTNSADEEKETRPTGESVRIDHANETIL